MNLCSDDFTIVWVDENNAQSDILFDRPSILTSIISNLQTFDKTSECFQYIESIQPNILVFLIISGQLGESIIDQLKNSEKIFSVYVYCTNRERHEKWAKNSDKIRGIYVDRTSLLNQLIADVALYSKELSAPITLFKRDDLDKKERSIQSLSKESALFMWFQLLFETLIHSKQTINARTDIINECKKEYTDNNYELKRIEEFDRSYSPNEAIRWYTRDCFLFRLVNKAMRTQNIDFIYKYRAFIIDLHKQLSSLNSNTQNIVEVYRGQLMTFEEIQQMRTNINGLISINTYFSTSIHSSVASNFSGGGLGRPNFESVIFTIRIQQNITDKPFALIQNFSYMSQEGEVLFTAGTVFRIIDVIEVNDGMWSVEVELSTDIQEQWHDVMLYLRTEMSERPTLVTLGNFLSEMGDLNKSEQYYNLLMGELENEDDRGSILTAIGAVHYRKKDFSQALHYCSQGLEQLRSLSYIHPDLGTAYNIMGTIYLELDRLDNAMHYFKYALNVHEKTLTNDHILIAADLNNIGMVDLQAHRFDIASDRLSRSLQIKLSVLPADHPLVGHGYANMALLYSKQQKWLDSHSFYDQAIEIQRKTLPPLHPDLATTYANKARVFVSEKQFDCALQLYKQALEIHLKRSPLCAHYLIDAYEQIGLICIHIADYSQAIRSFEKALQHALDSHAAWDQQCALRNNLGTAHFKTGDCSMALKEYETALHLIPNDDRSSRFVSTLNNIATIYFTMEKYSTALDFYQKLMDALNSLESLPSDANLVSIYQNIGLCYSALEKHDLALEYFARVLSLTQDLPILSKIHSYIADAYLGKNEFVDAVKNYERALELDSSNENFVIMTYNSLGIAYFHADDINSALCSCQQALSIQLTRDSVNDSELAATYNNIANIYCKAGNVTEAIHSYHKQLALETDANIRSQIEENIEIIQQSLSDEKLHHSTE